MEGTESCTMLHATGDDLPAALVNGRPDLVQNAEEGS